MLDYAFYELLYRNGSGYRCPRCYSFHGCADGFGMSSCHTCGIYFSVLSENSQVKKTLKKLVGGIRNWLKEKISKFRGKR